MKKLLTIIAVFTVFAAKSQSIGLKADAGAAWAGTNNNVWQAGDSRLSYSFGIFSDLKIYKGIYFSPELLFTHAKVNYQWKGGSYTDLSGISIQDPLSWSPIGINYIEAPLQIKIKDRFVYASTGISPMIPITGIKDFHTIGSQADYAGIHRTMYNNYSKFNLLYTIGAGFIVGKKLSIDFKYNYSLKPIDNIGYHLNRFSAGISYAIHN